MITDDNYWLNSVFVLENKKRLLQIIKIKNIRCSNLFKAIKFKFKLDKELRQQGFKQEHSNKFLLQKKFAKRSLLGKNFWRSVALNRIISIRMTW